MNKVLSSNTLQHLEDRLLEELSGNPFFQQKRIMNSPRAMGDTVQEVIGELLPKCLPADIISEFSADFARRAMADLAFTDGDNNYYLIDVKTHNTATQFNMPNLTSVHRLSRFYEDDRNYFIILLVEYAVENGALCFSNVRFVPIEHLKWSCLTIGALGWGQIQIANASVIHIDRTVSRKEWMLSLCDELELFYPKEIAKIEDRLDYFKTVRAFWEKK